MYTLMKVYYIDKTRQLVIMSRSRRTEYQLSSNKGHWKRSKRQMFLVFFWLCNMNIFSKTRQFSLLQNIPNIPKAKYMKKKHNEAKLTFDVHQISSQKIYSTQPPKQLVWISHFIAVVTTVYPSRTTIFTRTVQCPSTDTAIVPL